MALSTARIHRVRGRPPLLAAGIISLIHSHSSSVRSLGYIFSFIYPFYTTHEDFSDRLSENRSCKQRQSVWSRGISKRYCQDPSLILDQCVWLLTMVVCRYIWRYIWKLAACQHVKSSTQGKVATAARSEQ